MRSIEIMCAKHKNKMGASEGHGRLDQIDDALALNLSISVNSFNSRLLKTIPLVFVRVEASKIGL